MAKSNIEKRISQLEHQVQRSRPQQSIESLIVDESNYREKEAEILRAEQDGIEVIAIHVISGRKGEEPTGGYAEYLKRAGAR